jgi:hypothetical protein
MKIKDRNKHGTYMKSRNSMKGLMVYNMWLETNNLMPMIVLRIYKFCKFQTIINSLASNTIKSINDWNNEPCHIAGSLLINYQSTCMYYENL